MADGSLVPAERRTFLIEALPQADILLRVLGPFAVQGARVLVMESEQRAERTSIRIEVGGMDAGTAAHLVDRLRGIPAVRAVGVGWRASV